jgi:catechol 2,3-dioxygenase-like lactoylglutathione lyase family enzyme
MTIDARLERLVLGSAQPGRLSEYYAQTFGYRVARQGETFQCEADNRSLWIGAGAQNQLLESHFRFNDSNALEHFVSRLEESDVPYAVESTDSGSRLSLVDPDGRRLLFRVASWPRVSDSRRVIRLQHYALRTPDPAGLLKFYVDRLGFSVSDLVHDEAGSLKAAFLRADAEHHTLALFHAAQRQFDHFSCEALDWTALREWADAVSKTGAEIVWGIGRHGPGNDTFFMVRDPDGNLAEVSAELEVCADDRPIGKWPHGPRTLNLWGGAIMRS